MIRAALHSGAFLLLVGCSTLDASKISSAVGPDGHPVQVLELAGVECPDVFDRGAQTGGCHSPPIHLIFYPRDDANARAHELEHVAAMRHGPWLQYGQARCARVTVAGHTQWRLNDLICRGPDGRYFRG